MQALPALGFFAFIVFAVLFAWAYVKFCLWIAKKYERKPAVEQWNTAARAAEELQAQARADVERVRREVDEITRGSADNAKWEAVLELLDRNLDTNWLTRPTKKKPKPPEPKRVPPPITEEEAKNAVSLPDPEEIRKSLQ